MRPARIFLSGVLLGLTLGLVSLGGAVWIWAHHMFVMGVSYRVMIIAAALLLLFPLGAVLLLLRSGMRPRP